MTQNDFLGNSVGKRTVYLILFFFWNACYVSIGKGHKVSWTNNSIDLETHTPIPRSYQKPRMALPLNRSSTKPRVSGKWYKTTKKNIPSSKST